MNGLRTLRQFAQLAVLWRPRDPVPAGSFAGFLVAVLVLGASMAGWQMLYNERLHWEMLFTIEGTANTARDALGALIASAFVTHVLRRPGLFWLLATVFVAIVAVMRNLPYLWLEVFGAMPNTEGAFDDQPELLIAAGAWALLALWRFFGWADAYRPGVVRAFAALVPALALAAMVATFTEQDYLSPDWDAIAEDTPSESGSKIDLEAVISRQSAEVDAAVSRIARGTPGEIDLFVVSFAGDANEAVFGNEVRFAAQLFSRRFGAEGRVLTLANAESPVEGTPLATRTNLRQALRGIATKMDRDEDILLLFLTSHGTPAHEFYVALDTLPLNQIAPADLAGAIADAGIRWRAVVVSACFSGGFLPALEHDEAAVITAARADRPSFGCGTGADFTYFGRAFLVEALNETADLPLAFAIAAKRIAEREREEKQTASEPQLAMGDAFAAQWDAWLAAHPPGAPVPFMPLEPIAVPAPTSELAPTSAGAVNPTPVIAPAFNGEAGHAGTR